MNALRALRVLGLLEGGSLLVLIGVAMPLKYFYHWPLAVRIVGGIHGLLFLLFLCSVYRCKSELHWPARRALLACAAALLPGGPWILNRWLHRRYAHCWLAARAATGSYLGEYSATPEPRNERLGRTD